jgi:exoribonuclease II
MSKNKPPGWWRILLAVRRVAHRNPRFTSAEVGSEAKISPAEASAWLGKMVRWGYVIRTGSVMVEEAPRWERLYALTRRGEDRRPPALHVEYRKR